LPVLVLVAELKRCYFLKFIKNLGLKPRPLRTALLEA
jgi:hypothetical protein